MPMPEYSATLLGQHRIIAGTYDGIKLTETKVQ
jgi:hypothetical protein